MAGRAPATPAATRGQPAQSRAQYPAPALLVAAVQQLSAANGWSPDRVTRQYATSSAAREAACCSADLLPSLASLKRRGQPAISFGSDRDGYIVASTRDRDLDWPTTLGGRQRPVRMGRWLLGIERGHDQAHLCGVTSCIATYHLQSQSHAQNLRSIKRGRRKSQQLMGPAMAVVAERPLRVARLSRTPTTVHEPVRPSLLADLCSPIAGALNSNQQRPGRLLARRDGPAKPLAGTWPF